MPRPDAYLRLFAAQLQTAPHPLWWSQFLVRKGGCKPSGFSIIIFEPVLDAARTRQAAESRCIVQLSSSMAWGLRQPLKVRSSHE